MVRWDLCVLIDKEEDVVLAARRAEVTILERHVGIAGTRIKQSHAAAIEAPHDVGQKLRYRLPWLTPDRQEMEGVTLVKRFDQVLLHGLVRLARITEENAIRNQSHRP